jgi:hypothetical protein
MQSVTSILSHHHSPPALIVPQQPCHASHITVTALATPILPSSVMATLYYGSFVHSLSLDRLEYNVDSLIHVSPTGHIDWIERQVQPDQLQQVASKHGVALTDTSSALTFIELGQDEFICPGLIDTHTVSNRFGARLARLTSLTTRTYTDSTRLNTLTSDWDRSINYWTGYPT